MIKYLKIRKLRKLRLNKEYKWCKKEYQRLNETSRKTFPTFKEYSIAFQQYHNLKSNYMFNYGIFGCIGLSFTQRIQWQNMYNNEFSIQKKKP
jgi:hypothetical protein